MTQPNVNDERCQANRRFDRSFDSAVSTRLGSRLECGSLSKPPPMAALVS
jgi:hypothetical protein